MPADGPGWHVRPAGRRFCPVQRRPSMGGPALREDALRQRAAASDLRALVARDGLAAGETSGDRDRRVLATRSTHVTRRVRQRPRRRHGGRRPVDRGRNLRVDACPAGGGSGRRRRSLGGRAVGRHAGRHLRARFLDAATAPRTRRHGPLGPGAIPVADGSAGPPPAQPRRQGGGRVERSGDRRARRCRFTAGAPGLGRGGGRVRRSSGPRPSRRSWPAGQSLA